MVYGIWMKKHTRSCRCCGATRPSGGCKEVEVNQCLFCPLEFNCSSRENCKSSDRILPKYQTNQTKTSPVKRLRRPLTAPLCFFFFIQMSIFFNLASSRADWKATTQTHSGICPVATISTLIYKVVRKKQNKTHPQTLVNNIDVIHGHF